MPLYLVEKGFHYMTHIQTYLFRMKHMFIKENVFVILGLRSILCIYGTKVNLEISPNRLAGGFSLAMDS